MVKIWFHKRKYYNIICLSAQTSYVYTPYVPCMSDCLSVDLQFTFVPSLMPYNHVLKVFALNVAHNCFIFPIGSLLLLQSDEFGLNKYNIFLYALCTTSCNCMKMHPWIWSPLPVPVPVLLPYWSDCQLMVKREKFSICRQMNCLLMLVSIWLMQKYFPVTQTHTCMYFRKHG